MSWKNRSQIQAGQGRMCLPPRVCRGLGLPWPSRWRGPCPSQRRQRSLPAEACAGCCALGRSPIAGAGGRLTAPPPRAGTPVGAAPLGPAPAPFSLSSLGLSRRFVPCLGCGAALPPAWGGGNAAAAPAVAFSLGPWLPWLFLWGFCRLVVAWLRFSCSLGGCWRGTG